MMTRFRASRVVLAAAFVSMCVTCTTRGGSSEVIPDYSIEWVCAERPGRVRSLLDALDLSHPGLESVSAAVRAGDTEEACRALVAYYRDSRTAAWLRRPPARRVMETEPRADAVLRGQYTFYSVEGRVPRTDAGDIEWNAPGPDDHPEWMRTLHRHAHFRWLMDAWQRTADPKYLTALCRQIDDWITANPVPDRRTDTPAWQPLQASVRLRWWAEVFYGLQGADAFAAGARILMLSSVAEHADYLRRYHSRGYNHQVGEMLALATAAAAWPEFADAGSWMDDALVQMTDIVREQVYPDGALRELTSHYHYMVLRDFEQFAQTVGRSGREVPGPVRDGMERMWGYLAATMRPDGFMLLNNDSDLRFIRGEITAAARRYGHDDWARWMRINETDSVAALSGPPSRAFPWAGQLVMRDGWRADSQFAWFDHGPSGTAHQHADALHLSLAAAGRMLLVDGGRYTYAWGKWRNYFVGTASHNTIMIDGCRQELGPLEAETPDEGAVITDAYDFARGRFDAGYIGLDGAASHTRAVLYVRGRYWIVVDRVETDRPRELTALWHFHPDCTVAADGTSVVSTDAGAGNLRITPAAPFSWRVDRVRGRERPPVQGWHSPVMNTKEAATAAVYTAHAGGTVTFAWLLEPGRGTVSLRPVTLVTPDRGDGAAVIRVGGPEPVEAVVPMRVGAAPELTQGVRERD